MDPGRGEASRKRIAQDDEEPIRKKVRFLSKIVTRTYPKDDNHASTEVAGHEVQTNQYAQLQG